MSPLSPLGAEYDAAIDAGARALSMRPWETLSEADRLVYRRAVRKILGVALPLLPTGQTDAWRKALEFYADEDTYREELASDWDDGASDITNDRGRRARAALAAPVSSLSGEPEGEPCSNCGHPPLAHHPDGDGCRYYTTGRSTDPMCDGSCVLQETPICPSCGRRNARWYRRHPNAANPLSGLEATS